MAGPGYPIAAVEIKPGAGASNVINVSVGDPWVPALYVFMGRVENRQSTPSHLYEFELAVSVQVDGLHDGKVRESLTQSISGLIGLGSCRVRPILQSIELVAAVVFPNVYVPAAEVTLTKYELAFSCDPDATPLLALAWAIPLAVVPPNLTTGVHNLQTRASGPGDAVTG